jgi:hypothetical protein
MNVSFKMNYISTTYLHYNAQKMIVLPILFCKKTSDLDHPGACPLEFQSVMQILMECMLQWDVTKKTTKGKGIHGTVVAFSAADEEQGGKTLHCHWQIWVKEINQTVQNCLFHEDITIRDRARKTFCKQINNVITASYGAELCITHNCLNENNDVVHEQEMVQNIFQEQDPSTF